MPWQSSGSLVWPWKLGPLFIHVSACRCRAEMRNRAPGGSEVCTSNEETQAIFTLRDRLTSRFALQWGVILILSWVGTLLYPLDCGAYTRWCTGGATELSCSLCLQSSERWRVSGEHLARSSSQVQLECGVASLAPLSPLLLLCLTLLLWAPQRQPQGGKGRGERELQLLSSLPSSPAVFLWLFVMPPLLHSLP